ILAMLFEFFFLLRPITQLAKHLLSRTRHISGPSTFLESAPWPQEGLPLGRNSSPIRHFSHTNRARSERAHQPRLTLQTSRKRKDRRDVAFRICAAVEIQIEPPLRHLATICKRWEALRRRPNRE